jgi:hypothetical protein
MTHQNYPGNGPYGVWRHGTDFRKLLFRNNDTRGRPFAADLDRK